MSERGQLQFEQIERWQFYSNP